MALGGANVGSAAWVAECSGRGIVYLAAAVFGAILLAGCAGNNYAPVRDLERPAQVLSGSHRVGKGETLYAIAWRYGHDYRTLAAINGIRYPYRIYPGQKIRLSGAARKRSAAQRARSNKPSPKATFEKVRWHWPAEGKLVGRFSSGVSGNKGVDIRVTRPGAVKAAAAGSVVYAGSGLKGYGNLVIIKHNENFLSAYAHNKKILTKEKKSVKAGDKIAEIDTTSMRTSVLHFEIRKEGGPVNPLNYLPKRL